MPASRRHLCVALALFLAALAIRLFRLGEWSMWSDEVSTLRDAAHLRDVIGYPVGYALVGACVRLFGQGEFAARLVPALAGGAIAVVCYLQARRMLSERAALLGVMVLALTCYHIFFSQFARYYTLLLLFSTQGMLFAWRGLEENRRSFLVAAVALLCLAFWTHWTAALVVAALVCYLLALARRSDRPPGFTRANLAVLLLPFLAGGLAMIPVFVKFLLSWKGEADFSMERAMLTALKLAGRLEAPTLICGAIGAYCLVRTRDRAAEFLLSFALAPAAISVFFVGISQGGSRFGLVALIPCALLAGVGMDRLIESGAGRWRRLAWLLVALVFMALIVKDVLYFTVERGQRPRWREAVAFVASHAQPGARFYATTPAIFRYYARRDAAELSDFMPEHSSKPAPEQWLLVERVANVAPSPEMMERLLAHAETAAAFPLRVSFLDYSILVLRSPARGSEPPH